VTASIAVARALSSALLVLAAPSSAVDELNGLADPYVRVSDPPGHVFRVDPEDRHGHSAICRLERADGELVWEATLAPAPRDALVLADGSVAAFAWSVLWIFAPDGSAILDEDVESLQRHAVDAWPLPDVASVRPMSDPRRVAFGIRAEGGRFEQRVHSLDTGEEVERFTEGRAPIPALPCNLRLDPGPEPATIVLRELERTVLRLPEPSEMRFAWDAVLNASGRCVVLEARNKLHFFAPDGELQRSMESTHLKTRRSGVFESLLALDPNGTLFASSRTAFASPPFYMRVSPAGEELGIVEIDPGEENGGVRRRVLFLPSSGRAWAVGDGGARLLSIDGEVLRSVAKRPDRRWIYKVEGSAMASDGSLLLAEVRPSGTDGSGLGPMDMGPGSGAWHRFSADGELVASYEPRPQFGDGSAFDGEWLVAGGYGRLDLHRVEDGAFYRFGVPLADVGSKLMCLPFLVKPGELAVWRSDWNVVRYAWPPELPALDAKRDDAR
jgi:hypothetical protein